LTLEGLEARLLLSAGYPASVFDPGRGLLELLGPAVVRSNGSFIQVQTAGVLLSSDPVSPQFDAALTGATRDRLTAIGEGSAGTLTLQDLAVAGDLAIQANGAVTIAGHVSAAGSLAITADQVTVTGTLAGQSLALATTGLTDIAPGGELMASAGGPGGDVSITAGAFVNTGAIHADGEAGGTLRITAAHVLNAGALTADGSAGPGGLVRVQGGDAYADTAAALLAADGTSGGTVIEQAASQLFSSGRAQAEGLAGAGGTVEWLGQDVVLAGAQADASGTTGGGQVLVGGGRHGSDPTVPDAQTVEVSMATTLRADATTAGNGGLVVVWSNQHTQYAGSASAGGGPGGGAGGTLEVSSGGQLDYGGSADAGAPAGPAGTLLLDPRDFVLSATTGVFPQYQLLLPASGLSAAVKVIPLSTGNVVIADPASNLGANNGGVVYLFDGLTGQLLSTLVGTHANDQVGSGGVMALANGNFVVVSSQWNGGAGAVTWGDGTLGLSGAVSAANSLFGSQPGDNVGSSGVTALANGNYVVNSSGWNSETGAVTWSPGVGGISGAVSAANSLLGSQSGDGIGSGGVTKLSNGNYVVVSSGWNSGTGAATWGSGVSGVSGVVSVANSLLGANLNDQVGSGGVTALANGNYVVVSSSWNNGIGAVTWGSGVGGVIGVVGPSNSLVGTRPDIFLEQLGDHVGSNGVIALSNGNYVVDSAGWNQNVGAVTWGDGSQATSAVVGAANSLISSFSGDRIGGHGVTALTNGNYVVDSPGWNGTVGAVTWADGTHATSAVVAAANSLISSQSGDSVGSNGVTPLTNGNYVVVSSSWNGSMGAVTWGDGTQGASGAVSAANSLVGSQQGDNVGSNGVTALTNGNYVVDSANWHGNIGAVTWGDGVHGTSGVLGAANSLTGSASGDSVGSNGVTPLTNGNYVVDSSNWNTFSGAVTWGDGTHGTLGNVTAANSLVGSQFEDSVGSGGVTALANGNYVVDSPFWNSISGAVTWGSGTGGISGVVAAGNSFIGSPNNAVGSGGVQSLSDRNYLILTPNVGAVTFASGNTGATLDGVGTITPQNSLLGQPLSFGEGSQLTAVEASANGTFLVPYSDNGGTVVVGYADPNETTYARGGSQTITLTPDLVARTLAAGTDVTLQASSDIILNDPITVPQGGGSLTLEAGRSIILGASISVGGNLTLMANTGAAGRDPGTAAITMAPGVSLDAGRNVTVQMEAGAPGDAGAITLGNVTGQAVHIIGGDIFVNGTFVGRTEGPAVYLNNTGVLQLPAGALVRAPAGSVLQLGIGPVLLAATVDALQGVQLHSAHVTLNGNATITASSDASVQVDGVLDISRFTLSVNAAVLRLGTLTTLAGGTLDPPGITDVGAGVLAGSGTIVGPVSVAAGGHVDPGGPGTAGTLTMESGISFAPGANLDINLLGAAPGSGYGQLVITGGTINLAGANLNVVGGFTPAPGKTFTIIQGGVGAASGQFAQGDTVTTTGLVETKAILYDPAGLPNVVLTDLSSPPPPPPNPSSPQPGFLPLLPVESGATTGPVTVTSALVPIAEQAPLLPVGPANPISGPTTQESGGGDLTGTLMGANPQAPAPEYAPPPPTDQSFIRGWGAGGSAVLAGVDLTESLRAAMVGTEGGGDSLTPALDPVAERSFLLTASLSQADDNALNVEQLIQRQATVAAPVPPRANQPARAEDRPAAIVPAALPPPPKDDGEKPVPDRAPGLGRLQVLGAAAAGLAWTTACWYLGRKRRGASAILDKQKFLDPGKGKP
jgi:hypothetical protein